MAIRMSETEFAQLTGKRPQKKRINKFGAKKIKVNGIFFDSQGEYERYCHLKMLEKTGDIQNLRFHDKKDVIILIDDPVVRYVPDFCYDEKGKHVVEDFKGMQTKEFILKKKIIISMIKKGILNITFRIVKDENGYVVKEQYEENPGNNV